MADNKKKVGIPSKFLIQPVRLIPAVSKWFSKKGGVTAKAKSARDKKNNQNKGK